MLQPLTTTSSNPKAHAQGHRCKQFGTDSSRPFSRTFCFLREQVKHRLSSDHLLLEQPPKFLCSNSDLPHFHKVRNQYTKTFHFKDKVWKTRGSSGAKFSLKFRPILKEVNKKRHIQGKSQYPSSGKLAHSHRAMYVFLTQTPPTDFSRAMLKLDFAYTCPQSLLLKSTPVRVVHPVVFHI